MYLENQIKNLEEVWKIIDVGKENKKYFCKEINNNTFKFLKYKDGKAKLKKFKPG